MMELMKNAIEAWDVLYSNLADAEEVENEEGHPFSDIVTMGRAIDKLREAYNAEISHGPYAQL